MILQQLQYHISMFVLSASTSGYISKHHLHAYVFVTGIATLLAQHCSQGTQVSMLLSWVSSRKRQSIPYTSSGRLREPFS